LKFSIDSTTLTEADVHDNGEMVPDVTSEALQDFMQEALDCVGGPQGVATRVTGATPSSKDSRRSTV